MKTLIERTSSGQFCANEVMMPSCLNTAGFGGVGESGTGRYIGHAGFKAFSNRRTIFERPSFTPSFVLDLVSPPFKN